MIEVLEDVIVPGDVADIGAGSDDVIGDTTLPELLVFDIELPEGSVSEVSSGTATLTLPIPMDVAQILIQEAFEGAGYTLDPDLSTPSAGVLWYDNGDKQWYITLTEINGLTEVFIF